MHLGRRRVLIGTLSFTIDAKIAKRCVPRGFNPGPLSIVLRTARAPDVILREFEKDFCFHGCGLVCLLTDMLVHSTDNVYRKAVSVRFRLSA